jgi:hypothetical protein
MSEISLEEVIGEKAFALVLQTEAEMFLRLTHTLLARDDGAWNRRHYFQLMSEADALEAFLDDHGARHNRTYYLLRELVASARGFAMTGFSVTHLAKRLDSYGVVATLGGTQADELRRSIRITRDLVRGTLLTLLGSIRDQAAALGLAFPTDAFPEDRYEERPRLTLPRNVGQEDLQDDGQKVAEVASKFLQAGKMLEVLGVRRIEDERQREAYLSSHCREEQARTYEATVHNLQSAYDTYIKNTLLESKDERLPKLRGHASITLHLLEAVTHLTHFVERHEGKARNEAVDVVERLVSRPRVRDVTLNHLLYWAARFMAAGRSLAEELLPSYTNVQAYAIDLTDDLLVHARPAALIVGIVNRYATPVEMEIGTHRCNAGSILELMIAVGSNPDTRHFVFRGDVNPLRDIALLFEHRLGEDGIDTLPPELGYLRDR